MKTRAKKYPFSALVMALTLVTATAFGQTKTTYKEQNVGLTPLEEGQPDTTGLWYHINQKQTALANREFQRLQEAYPHWQIPDDVKTEIARINGRLPKAIAVQPESAAGDETPLDNQAKDEQTPPSLSAPLEGFAQLSEQQRANLKDEAFAQLIRLTNRLQRADFHLLMGWTALARNAWETAEQQFTQARAVSKTNAEQQSAAQGLDTLASRKTQQAIDNHNLTLLKEWLTGAQAAVVSQVIEGEAWQQYEAQQYSYAFELFLLIEDVEGQYLTLWSDGQRQQALDLACQTETTTFVQRCADGLAQQQVDFYNRRDYQNSIGAAQQLQTIRPLKLEEQTLLGWAAAKDGQASLATSAFTEVLDATPNDQVIGNELITLNKNNDVVLAQLSDRFAVVNRLRQVSEGQASWGQKQFLFAYLNGDERATQAHSRDSFSVTYGLTTRSRSGEEGLGNFDVLTQSLGISDVYQNWQWRLGVDVVQFYAGEVQQNAWFADGQLSAPFNGITGFEDQRIRGELVYQAKGMNFYANLNYGMLDQPVNAKLTGQVSATWFLPRVTLATSVFRKEKQDSMLSQTGTYDANHESPWGYVIEDGIRLLAAYGITTNLSLAGTLQLSQLSGELVKDNEAISLRTDLSYNIASVVSSKLDYWRLGPYTSYTEYRHNLSGFTYGNGGYFSPDYLISTGIYTELLTAETRHWQIKLKGTLGVSHLAEQDDPRFPLYTDETPDNDNASLGYNRSTGVSGNLMVEGQYRLTDNWIVAGYMGKAFAVEYQAFEAGLQIRWRGGKGKGVLSDELLLSSPRHSGFAL
ncbi:BCSC C-terminal domain-containing protein [Alteromonas sp. C1M14]|nr:BCSC C-terminal domain-containing protein [Alteromonas sp. C1M14]